MEHETECVQNPVNTKAQYPCKHCGLKFESLIGSINHENTCIKKSNGTTTVKVKANSHLVGPPTQM